MSYTVQAAGTTAAYPPALTKTGTVSSSGIIVTGVGTAFFTDLFNTGGSPHATLKYKWLYSAVQGEVREIININSDTILQIKSAFSGNLAGENFMVITDDMRYDNISLNPLGAGPLLATAGSASALMDANTTKNIDNPYDFPIVVKATSFAVEVLS